MLWTIYRYRNRWKSRASVPTPLHLLKFGKSILYNSNKIILKELAPILSIRRFPINSLFALFLKLTRRNSMDGARVYKPRIGVLCSTVGRLDVEGRALDLFNSGIGRDSERPPTAGSIRTGKIERRNT